MAWEALPMANFYPRDNFPPNISHGFFFSNLRVCMIYSVFSFFFSITKLQPGVCRAVVTIIVRECQSGCVFTHIQTFIGRQRSVSSLVSRNQNTFGGCER